MFNHYPCCMNHIGNIEFVPLTIRAILQLLLFSLYILYLYVNKIFLYIENKKCSRYLLLLLMYCLEDDTTLVGIVNVILTPLSHRDTQKVQKRTVVQGNCK